MVELDRNARGVMPDVLLGVSSGADTSRSSGRHVPKYLLFASFGLMALFVLWNNERFLLDPQAPEWTHFLPIRWHLIPHGLGGAVALTFGALQFSTRLRRRHLRLHRLSGKVYIAGTFVAAPVAIWMAFISSPWFLVPFTVIQASTWILFTLVAYVCIRRGDSGSHRQWMMRSYAIALIFLEGRVLMAIPALARQGMDAIVLVNWACFALTLVLMECILHWREIFPSRVKKAVADGAA